jgi:hypothetical protein
MTQRSVVDTTITMRRLVGLAPAVFVLLVCSPAHADPNRPLPGLAERKLDRPKHSLFLRNTSIGRLNPLGLIDLLQIGYRRRLYKEDEPALADNFVGVGLVPALSPAFGRFGPIVEFQPASILQLWASYEVVRYFGGFNLLQSFGSPLADFSGTEIHRRGQLPKNDPQANYAATGTQLNLGATAQIKIGPIAIRNLFRAMRPDYHLRAGDRVVYDILFDVLVPDGGWFINNDVDALVVTKFGFSFGARWTSNYAFYRARDYAPGEDTSQNPNTPMHRVGPVLAYSFWKDRGGAFDNPTVLFIANWWLEHRWRTGQDVSPSYPYLALGFQFTGELMPQPPPPPDRPKNGLPYEQIPVAPNDPRLER